MSFLLSGSIIIKYFPGRLNHNYGGGVRVQFHTTVAQFRHTLHCMAVRRTEFSRLYPFQKYLETGVQSFSKSTGPPYSVNRRPKTVTNDDAKNTSRRYLKVFYMQRIQHLK